MVVSWCLNIGSGRLVAFWVRLNVSWGIQIKIDSGPGLSKGTIVVAFGCYLVPYDVLMVSWIVLMCFWVAFMSSNTFLLVFS